MLLDLRIFAKGSSGRPQDNLKSETVRIYEIQRVSKMRFLRHYYDFSVAETTDFYKVLKHSSFQDSFFGTTFAMKALPVLKLLVMLVVAAWMHVLAAPAQADSVILADSGATPAAKVMGVPETSSVVLIGALGVTLMLRRRRLHA
jgi:hypothetical protein